VSYSERFPIFGVQYFEFGAQYFPFHHRNAPPFLPISQEDKVILVGLLKNIALNCLGTGRK
jgi:hypothetical protein